MTTKKKSKVVYVHFNKSGSVKDRPWTVHTSNSCIPAKSVQIFVSAETVWKPLKKTNPRAMIKVKGFVHHMADGVIWITRSPEAPL